jgi:hypothetical protein
VSSNPPKSDISISLLSSTSTASAVGSSVSPVLTDVGDSESAGAAVGVDEPSPVGESVPPAAVGDSDSESAGGAVGVGESSPVGKNAGFFVGIVVVSFPPPSLSGVGL